MRALELFAGMGGLGLAVEAALGASTAAVAETDRAASQVLAARFPHAPNLGDVTRVDWGRVEPVDVVSGGSPCTDVSLAGGRAGMVPGSRSNLWVAQRTAVSVLRPRFVVWENVVGARTSHAASTTDPDGERGYLRAAGRVLGDLAELGYDAEWGQVRACDVGACHRRTRLFVLAWDRGPADAADVDRPPWASWDRGRDRFEHPGGGVAAVVPEHGAMRAGGLHPRRPPTVTGRVPRLLPTPTASDRYGPGAHGDGAADLRTTVSRLAPGRWGPYASAVTRHAHLLGLPPAPPPTVTTSRGASQLSGVFAEWMMGLDRGWVSDPRLGLKRREQLVLLGNGVMPLQGTRALQLLLARSGQVTAVPAVPGGASTL